MIFFDAFLDVFEQRNQHEKKIVKFDFSQQYHAQVNMNTSNYHPIPLASFIRLGAALKNSHIVEHGEEVLRMVREAHRFTSISHGQQQGCRPCYYSCDCSFVKLLIQVILLYLHGT